MLFRVMHEIEMWYIYEKKDEYCYEVLAKNILEMQEEQGLLKVLED